MIGVGNLRPSRRLGWMVAVLAILGTVGQLRAQEKTSQGVLTAFRKVVAKPSESTVRVLCNEKEASLGTIVSEDGWIITKASELKGKIVCKLKSGKSFPAKLVGVEEKTDLALLKIEARGLKPIEWADIKSAVVGNWLASPGTGTDPVAIGVVSVAARRPALQDMPRPADAGYLGIMLANGSDGAKIESVSPRSPASKAGLKAGDLVLKVGGQAVKDPGSVVMAIQAIKAGKTITLEIKRGEEVKEVKATLEKRPAELADRADFQNGMGSKLSNRRGGFPVILQHDQVIKPTDCGGPLVDLDGKAVGINIARAGRTESYAIPSDAVLALLPDLKSGKLAPKEEPEPVIDLGGLETTLKQTRDAVANAEKALKAAELKKKQLEEQLAEAKKKEAAAQAALDKARKDATKK